MKRTPKTMTLVALTAALALDLAAVPVHAEGPHHEAVRASAPSVLDGLRSVYAWLVDGLGLGPDPEAGSAMEQVTAAGGVGMDPNGSPTASGGVGMDPNGSPTAAGGVGMDPNG